MSTAMIEAAASLPALFAARVAAKPSGIALRHHELGRWKQFTWSDVATRVDRATTALAAIGVRDGSRVGVLERVDEKKKEEEVKKEAQAMPIRKRPLALSGVTHETQTPLGNTFITINHDSEGKPFELFINSGK